MFRPLFLALLGASLSVAFPTNADITTLARRGVNVASAKQVGQNQPSEYGKPSKYGYPPGYPTPPVDGTCPSGAYYIQAQENAALARLRRDNVGPQTFQLDFDVDTTEQIAVGRTMSSAVPIFNASLDQVHLRTRHVEHLQTVSCPNW